MVQHVSYVGVGVINDRAGHTQMGCTEGGEPLAVDIHAVLDRLKLSQRQIQAVAQHLE